MANQDTPDTTRDARLEARVSAAQKSLLQQAAALSGRTLSEFVVASAQDAARRVIAEHESIRLSREEQLAFVQALRGEDLFKRPGVAETLDWARCLVALDVVALTPEVIADTVGAILKYRDDIDRIRGGEAGRLLAAALAEVG